jgi:peptidyl-prolyl cis-trans isomerase C
MEIRENSRTGGDMIIRILVLTVTIGMLLTDCLNAEDLNPVAGKAGDFILREADLDRLLGSQSYETQKIVQNSPEQRTNFVKQFLLTKATAAKARRDGFDKKPEIKELLSNLMDQYLAQEYLNKVVVSNVSVTDEELKKYYGEHEKDLQIPAAVKVRHIYIASPKDSAVELKEKAKAKAENILQLIKKGGDFAKIAAEQSEDADSASKGGDLGFITQGKTNSLEFEKAVFALKPGESGNLVETPFGYHIIRVDELKEQRTATLAEAREYISNLLTEENKKQKAVDFIEKLTKETGLEVTAKP